MQIRNRRTAGLTFAANRWAAGKAADEALAKARSWGYASLDAEDFTVAAHILIDTAVADGGKRVSLHIADQDRKVLMVALSHRPGAPEDAVLAELAAVRAVDSCGTDAAPDGRRVWALLDTTPRRRRTPGATA
ncbi:hypothetical protein [Streptomyces sp. NPDC051000]|uniref:hypothetical protein n=1 Tax=Streptomyces sp. NPDC051000 TaxID=3155520 RepID=UPI0033C306E9